MKMVGVVLALSAACSSPVEQPTASALPGGSAPSAGVVGTPTAPAAGTAGAPLAGSGMSAAGRGVAPGASAVPPAAPSGVTGSVAPALPVAGVTAAAGSGVSTNLGGSLPSAAGSVAAPASAGAGAAGSGVGPANGPALGCPAQPLAAGEHTFTLKSANRATYTYFVHVPKSIDPNKKSPVVFKWHAYTSSPEEFRKLEKVDEVADKAGTIMVYPKSPDGSWDTGSCCKFTGANRDEEVFARELYKEVLGKVCADEKRIYTTGLSNGAMMSQMLACKMSDMFAAAVTVVGTLTIPKAQCTPKRPIPILMINGTQDPLVGFNRPGLAGGLSVPDDHAFWAAKNQCTGEPETTIDKGKATCKTYKTCAAEVAFCVAEGMGHCMPGMVKESDTNCLTHGTPLGPPNDDIDGVQMGSDFLLRFTLP